MSNATERVTVKSFSGATVDDMKDFIKPVLRKNPDKLILHIGTNDLRNADSKRVADSISNLVQSIIKKLVSSYQGHCFWNSYQKICQWHCRPGKTNKFYNKIFM
jgi:lysophospholipase L1-like esterase